MKKEYIVVEVTDDIMDCHRSKQVKKGRKGYVRASEEDQIGKSTHIGVILVEFKFRKSGSYNDWPPIQRSIPAWKLKALGYIDRLPHLWKKNMLKRDYGRVGYPSNYIPL